MKSPNSLLCFCFVLLFSTIFCQRPVWTPTAPDVTVSVMKTTVNIVSNLAQTTVEIHLKNPSSRVGEGELLFPLPQGVSVDHYALDINGVFRDAVPVDKNKGTQVFEALETVRVDPGILQKTEEGNSFKTRVFPIPAGGSRKILIGYQEELDLNEKNQFFYRMVSSYPKAIDKFTLTINVVADSEPVLLDDDTGSKYAITKSGSAFSYNVEINNGKPSKSISIRVPQVSLKSEPITTYASGRQYFYGYVNPDILSSPSTGTPASNIAIVWDTSLSCKGRNTAKEFQLLEDYFNGRSVRVSVYFIGYYFWQTQSFSVSNGNWQAFKSFLQKVRYDGGTKFSEIKLTKKFDQVLFFSDGISSLGKASDAQFASGQTVHCINSNPTASHDFLNYLALTQSGNYVDLTRLSSVDAAKLLKDDVVRFQGIEDNPSVSEVYPQAGTPVSRNLFSFVGKADSLPQAIVLKFGRSADSITERITVQINDNSNDYIKADKLWAQLAITNLEYNYEENKDQVDGLGSRYGIVTKGTSLIVLENLNDYIRFGIVPPAELRQQYDDILKQNSANLETQKQSGASKLQSYWAQLQQWWNNPTLPQINPSPPRPVPIPIPFPRPSPFPWLSSTSGTTRRQSIGPTTNGAVFDLGSSAMGAGGGSVFSPASTGVAGRASTGLQSIDSAPQFASGSVASEVGFRPIQSMAVAPALSFTTASATFEPASAPLEFRVPSQPTATTTTSTSTSTSFGSAGPKKQFSISKGYMASIKTPKTQTSQYTAYLSERDSNSDNPTFYIDAAEFFFPINGTLALQILSNIADLSLQNAFLYKTLSYYFKQFNAYADCLYAAKKVNDWRPFEPQSHRDLALAYELVGDIKSAAEELSQVINTTYYNDVANKVDGLQDTILMDVNRLVNEYGSQYFVGKFADQYLKPLPVDIRIVMTWNQVGVDLDLHVIDPNGQECYYGHKRTAIGGRFSKDFTTGLGPEQFLLKNATKGEYTIKSNYYGETKLTNSGPTTVNVEVYLRLRSGKVSRSYKTLQMVNVKQDGYLGRINV